MSTEVVAGVHFWTRDEVGLRAPKEPIPTAQKIEYIQHHSGGTVLGRADFAAWTREIQRFHMLPGGLGVADGASDIAYNFLIANDGSNADVAHVLEGRSWNGVGGHTVGHNTSGIGVCYLRNGPANNAVKRAARWIYDEASKREDKQLRMAVHRDFANTACPGSELDGWVHAGMQPPPSLALVATAPSITGQAAGLAACDGGYWIAGSDGGVFTYGLAQFHGSAVGLTQHSVTGIAGLRDGTGYWLCASDGGVFAFGAAQFFGSMGGKQLNKPVIAISATPTGRGYRLIAEDGGTFCFGDAEFYGAPVR